MIRKNVWVNGLRTSTSLEPEFWDYLEIVAACRGIWRSNLIKDIASEEPARDNLASVLRVWCLKHALSSPSKQA